MKKKSDMRWYNCMFRYMVGAVAAGGKSIPIWPLHCKYGCKMKCGAWTADKFHFMQDGNRDDWRRGNKAFKKLCKSVVEKYGMKVGLE